MPTERTSRRDTTASTRGTRLTALDLCSGAGGVTTGLKKVGVRVIGAVDNDPDCVETMRANHRKTKVLSLDLSTCKPGDLRKAFGLRPGELDILTFCSPCQTFSSIGAKNRKPNDSRSALVTRIGAFVEDLRPRALIMENVPQLRSHQLFTNLLKQLEKLGYAVEHKVVCASAAGVPQRRKRLVCIAIRGKRKLPVFDLSKVTKGVRKIRSVKAAFKKLSACKPGDPLNLPRRAEGVVADRLRKIPKNGGSRASLPKALELECHKRLRERGAAGSSNVYGRMDEEDLAPTMTTRCTTPACGRFTHPSKLRPITLREAALLQTFPPRYQFRGTRSSVERQIGNAVPVMLATATVRYAIENMRTRRV